MICELTTVVVIADAWLHVCQSAACNLQLRVGHQSMIDSSFTLRHL